jgi:ABC-2 type transport system permease protein
MLVMLGLGPVLIPPDRLPGIMLILGRLSPATYAASAH